MKNLQFTHHIKRVAAMLFFCITSYLTFAQSQAAPTVAWNKYYWLPDGVSNDDGAYSGSDWMYGISKAVDHGKVIGYIGAGYSHVGAKTSIPLSNGCISRGYPILYHASGSSLNDLEVIDANGNIQWGETWQEPKIVFYDLNGNQKWYKTYTPSTSHKSDGIGTFYRVVQTNDGGFIAVGFLYFTNNMNYRSLMDNSTVNFDYINSCNSAASSAKFGYITKVDKDGNVQWQTSYGWDAITSNSTEIKAVNQEHGGGFFDVVVNPTTGNCYVTGSMTTANNSYSGSCDNYGFLFLAEINPNDGSVIRSKIYDAGTLGSGTVCSRARSIAFDGVSSIYVSGWTGTYRTIDGSNNVQIINSVPKTAALVAKIDASNFNILSTYSYASPSTDPVNGFAIGIQANGLSKTTTFNPCDPNSIPPPPSMPPTAPTPLPGQNSNFKWNRYYEYDALSLSLTIRPNGNILAAIEEDNQTVGNGCLACAETAKGKALARFVELSPTLSIVTPLTSLHVPSIFGEDTWLTVTNTSDGGFAFATTVQSQNTPTPYTKTIDKATGLTFCYRNDLWNTDAHVEKYNANANFLWARDITESTDEVKPGSWNLGSVACNERINGGQAGATIGTTITVGDDWIIKIGTETFHLTITNEHNTYAIANAMKAKLDLNTQGLTISKSVINNTILFTIISNGGSSFTVTSIFPNSLTTFTTPVQVNFISGFSAGNIGDPRLQGDLRRQECMFHIIEGAEPNSLLIAGKNTNNLDDDNLIKLNSDCQTQLIQTLTPNTFTGGAIGGNAYVNNTTAGADIVINGNVIWNANGYVFGTVIVPANAILTIQNSTLQFLSSSKTNNNNNYDACSPPLKNPSIFSTIIVEQGGKLIIDNATLEGCQTCNDTWDGIEVWGASSFDQTLPNQGVVQMINGGVIKDAITGIQTQKYDRTAGAWDGQGGGIVQVDNGNFINCRIGVRFADYPRSGTSIANNSVSHFNNCNFTTDANTLQGLNTHVTMVDIHGVSFKSCSFSSPTTAVSPGPAYGIASFNSEYTLGTLQTPADACTFTNLHRGQVAWGSSPSKFSGASIKNENTVFNDCDFPLYYQGTNGCVTNNCNINYTGNYYQADASIAPYGIYLDGVGGDYFCENNTIAYAGSYAGGGPQYGIIVADHADLSTIHDHKVRANTIAGLPAGLAAAGFNGANLASGDKGLQFLCNEITSSFADIQVTGYDYYDNTPPVSGMMRDQGRCPSGNILDPTLSDPANNTFAAQDPIVVGNDVVSPFTYYFPIANGNGDGGSYSPTGSNQTTVIGNLTMQPCNIDIHDLSNNTNAYTSLCLPRNEKILIISGLHVSDIMTQLQSYDNVKQNLWNLIDGGNTEQLKTLLDNASIDNIVTVMAALCAKDAVSDEVLAKAIKHPLAWEALTTLRELIIKNSGLSLDVVNKLLEASLAFSASEIADMAAAQDAISPLKAILNKISDQTADRDEYLHSVISQWDQEGREDDIETLLKTEASTESMLMLCDRLLTRGDAEGANVILKQLQKDAVCSTGELILRRMEIDQIDAGLPLSQLSGEAILSLREIIKAQGGAEVMRAKALLQMNTGETYQEYIPKMDKGHKSKTASKPDLWKQMRTVEKQSLSVSPNPSINTATITTHLINTTSLSVLLVTDVLGNKILTKTLLQTYDTTILPVAGLASGVYQCTVQQNGKTIMNDKIVVTH